MDPEITTKEKSGYARCLLHAFLHSNESYYMYEVIDFSFKTHEKIGRFGKIELPTTQQLKKITSYDDTKKYLIMTGQQILEKQKQPGWNKLMNTRVDNYYVFFAMDKTGQVIIARKHKNETKTDIPQEFYPREIVDVLNDTIQKLDDDGITEILSESNLDENQFDNFFDAMNQDNKTKVMSSYLSDQQIADIEQSIQEPKPEKTEQQQQQPTKRPVKKALPDKKPEPEPEPEPELEQPEQKVPSTSGPPEPDQGFQQIQQPISNDEKIIRTKNHPATILQNFPNIGLQTTPIFSREKQEQLSSMHRFKHLGPKINYPFCDNRNYW